MIQPDRTLIQPEKLQFCFICRRKIFLQSQLIVWSLALFLSAMALSGCASLTTPDDDQPLQPLSSAEIRTALTENSLYRRGGRWWRRWEYTGFYRADGSVTGRVWWSGGEEIVQGHWNVTAAALFCRTWENNWGDGKRGCFRVSRAGDRIVFDYVSGSSGGAERFSYRYLTGNPQGL